MHTAEVGVPTLYQDFDVCVFFGLKLFQAEHFHLEMKTETTIPKNLTHFCFAYMCDYSFRKISEV